MIACEQFPSTYEGYKPFIPLFIAHGLEVADRPMCLDIKQYLQIQKEGRLVWVVARDVTEEKCLPVGYSCHVIYVDRHFCLDGKIAADDIWYVDPEYRGKGIGKGLKQVGIKRLKELGVTKSFDLIRRTEHKQTMESLGYTQWGTRWVTNFSEG